MPISILKSQKTSSSLSNFYINYCKEEGIRVGTLYLIFYNLEKVDKSLS